ncbi:hypothetical protein JOF56_002322 [Kibdelosporangium banguiense]|uniref:Uncharacterized protein n=1 Tax=Kibdelosporangium banguiense TaxID=1365924 RepID=A0ABS4TBY0_9PSEU|nr:hypothetical protein [Kibdelosporangium banguiense]
MAEHLAVVVDDACSDLGAADVDRQRGHTHALTLMSDPG